MALVQPVNVVQVQQKIDDFANQFIALEETAEDLVQFATELTPGNPMLRALDGTQMADATVAELARRLNAMQGFVTWATTGNPSPVKFLRSVKRVV